MRDLTAVAGRRRSFRGAGAGVCRSRRGRTSGAMVRRAGLVRGCRPARGETPDGEAWVPGSLELGTWCSRGDSPLGRADSRIPHALVLRDLGRPGSCVHRGGPRTAPRFPPRPRVRGQAVQKGEPASSDALPGMEGSVSQSLGA